MLVKRGDFAIYCHGAKGDEWVCTNAQIWRSEKYGVDVICDKTEIINLASIPFWARWAIPVNGRSRNPAAMHDPAYAKHVGYKPGTVTWDLETGELDMSKAEAIHISRALADKMIKEACVEFKVSKVRTAAITLAVKIGGAGPYEESYSQGGTWLPEEHHSLYLSQNSWAEA